MMNEEEDTNFLDGFLNNDIEEEAAFFDDKEGGFDDEDEAEKGKEISGAMKQQIKMDVIATIKEIYDPEIPVNIYELGLIYRVDVDNFANVLIVMTLTTPNCPVAESMPAEVEIKAGLVENVSRATIELTFEPPWDMSMMSEAARLEMGMM